MFQNVERYVDFITTNRLTQAQFLMLYLIYRKKYDCIKLYKERVPTDDGTMIGQGAKEDLVTRGFIVKVDDEEKADSYELTNKFLKLFLKDKHEAAEQFWDKYPGFININGSPTPLTNMDKYKFALIYAERIDHSVDEHLEVMKDLEFGVNNNLIRSSIENFVKSEGWLKLRPYRLNKEVMKKAEELSKDF